MAAKTITPRFGTGLANLAPGQNAGQPHLAEILLEQADSYNGDSGLLAAVVVTTHVVTLAVAGMVLWVESVTGSTTGRCALGTSAPATLEAQVVYDTAGIATITFNATDAVTAADIQILASPILRGA